MMFDGGAITLFWLLWLVASFAIFALLVWVAVRIARMAWGSGEPPRAGMDPALQILRERYARGEITAEEFEERRRKLGV